MDGGATAVVALAHTSSINAGMQLSKPKDATKKDGGGGGGGGAVGAGHASSSAGVGAGLATIATGLASSVPTPGLRPLVASRDTVPLPLDVKIARQDAMRVCNPDIQRPFTSLEDACERLLPFHIVADYDADDASDRFLDSSGRVFGRLQLWNEGLTAKINEFKSTLEKQIENFNSMAARRADGDMHMEERLMLEQFLLQDEKQKLIDLKVEAEARERAEREAEARMKEAIAQAERLRAEAKAQAQAEAFARAEAVRMQVQAEAAQLQAPGEAVRMQTHGGAVFQTQAEALRRQVHAETQRIQAQGVVGSAKIQTEGAGVRMQVEPYDLGVSQSQAEENTTLETDPQEQDGMVDAMLDVWEPLDEDDSESDPDDVFSDNHVVANKGFHFADLLATNAMQGEWKETGMLDLNSLNSR